jgi:hypothetical protein
MSYAWGREIHIITAAAAGGIRVRGIECAYLVRDASGAFPDVAVKTVEDLRELIPALHPVGTTLECTDAERQELRTLCGLSNA